MNALCSALKPLAFVRSLIFRITVLSHILHAQDSDALAIKTALRVHGLDARLEKLLRDERRHKCAQDHHTDQNCVLPLIDDFVLQTEQRRDRAESQPGCQNDSRPESANTERIANPSRLVIRHSSFKRHILKRSPR